jgi:hypothetical protein
MNYLSKWGSRQREPNLLLARPKVVSVSSTPRTSFHAAQLCPVQDALEWLDKTQNVPIDELNDAGSAGQQIVDTPSSSSGGAFDADGDKAETTGAAASLKCMDCGKLFSSPERAEFHASRT